MEFSSLTLKQYDSLILTFTAISALVIYRMKAVDDIKAAASAVRLQIKDIERKLSLLKKFCIEPDFVINESYMFNSSSIYETNQWDIYQHKLSPYLSIDEYELISAFYEDVSVIKRLQNDVKQFFLFSLQNRSVNYYNASFSVLNNDDSPEQYQIAINNIRSKFNNVSVQPYIPKHYGMYLSKYLDEHKPLVGTTAFQKLEKLVDKKAFIIF